MSLARSIFLITCLLLATTTVAAPRVLRVRTLGDPLTFDWNRAFSPVEATLIRNIMEGLVEIGTGPGPNSMKVVPALAQKWEISADGKTYTFHLRKDVKWSDGAPLSAEHFVDSWKRLLSPAFNANYAYLLFDIENAEDFHRGSLPDFGNVGVKALDAHTLQVKLRAPVAYWIWIPTFWATFPIRQDIINQLGSSWDKAGKIVSLGPFLLDSYESRRKAVLKRNPTYYGKRGNIDEVIAALVEDDAAAVKLYQDKQLDFITKISFQDANRLGVRSDFTRWAEARIVHLDLNPNQEPTSSVQFRKAIAMAIDREKLAGELQGASQAATSLVSPGILSYSKDFGLPYDPGRARKLLVNSGFAGKPIRLELVTLSYTDEALAGKFIAENLRKNLGVEVNVSVYDPKQYYSPAVNFSGFTLLVGRWTADYPDPDNFLSIFLSGAGNNRVSWKNARYDELVKQARSLTTPKDREKLYRQAQKLLIDEEVIAVPLYYGKSGALVRPTVKGFRPTPTNSYLFKDFSLP